MAKNSPMRNDILSIGSERNLMDNKHNNDRQGLIKIQNLTSVVLRKQSREESLLPERIKADGYAEVSIFGGETATPNEVLTAINKLTTAFPKQSQTFWELLAMRVTERGMSASELEYCVNETIDNFNYQTLTIADIMKQGRDKRFRLMSYSQMLAECAKNGATTKDYCAVKVNGCDKPCWVSKFEKAMYNIPDEL